MSQYTAMVQCPLCKGRGLHLALDECPLCKNKGKIEVQLTEEQYKRITDYPPLPSVRIADIELDWETGKSIKHWRELK